MGKQEFAVIGLGRFGQNVALTLEQSGHHVLGIDVSEEKVQALSTQLTQAIILDSTQIDALKAVDIMSFDTVIVAIGSNFEGNIMTTVSLKELGVKCVICKATTNQQENILLRVGADQVVLPEREAGRRLADNLINPGMLEKFSLTKGSDYSIVEFAVPTSLCNQTLMQSGIRARFGISILVINRGADVIVHPPANTVLQNGDVIVTLGHEKDLQNFSQLA
ncbi:MAG: trk system potassium uptake protein TrkA [Cellvibrionaceae bacterium]|jgi:trk system potassium uptake protein TrkA